MTKQEALKLKAGDKVYAEKLGKTREYEVLNSPVQKTNEEFFVYVKLGCCQRMTINRMNVEQFRITK
jgi:hypothetical protein